MKKDLKSVLTKTKPHPMTFSIMSKIPLKTIRTIGVVPFRVGELSLNVSPEKIIIFVCDYYELPISDLKSNCRKRFILEPRQIAMYLMREYTRLSYISIGTYFGDKDHATVIHACRHIKNMIETERKVARDIRQIELKIEQLIEA